MQCVKLVCERYDPGENTQDHISKKLKTNMENEKIIEIIAQIAGMNMEDIALDDELKILGINSLETVELLLELEETFEIAFDISDLDIDELGSVESVINLTNRYIVKREDI